MDQKTPKCRMKSKCYIIAEAGVNHNGQLQLARELIDRAAEAGADAVKFQTFDSIKLANRHAPKASYQKLTTEATESQFEMLRKLELPQHWHHELRERAKSCGLEFLSTAFDADSLDFLESLELPFYKVPSGEITNGPLLWKFARQRKPLVVSTGMATLSEVEQALAVIAHAFNVDTEPQNLEEVWRGWSRADWRHSLQGRVTLLHCTSQYPTPVYEVNLSAMDTLRHSFGLPVGYSDHTEGILIPLAAAARGAVIIEKHFTLDRTMKGPDHGASLEPNQLALMIREIKSIMLALGDGIKSPQESEWDTRKAARQQVVVTRDIRAGEIFARNDLSTARSGRGQPPLALWGLVGSIASRDYRKGETI
jgi:N-acetylneuraminate synthase